jgi:hypothetical protein
MSDRLDEAFSLLEATAPEYSGGIVNHGTMVAGAMRELKREENILPWVAHYRGRLEKQCPPRREIRDETWTRYLGRFEYCSAWTSFFARKTAGDWREIAGEWLARLAPGASASGGQALLRTAHALRALENRDNPIRRKELAHSLGYWAARHRRLPGNPAHSAGSLKPSEAIHLIRRLPAGARPRFVRIDRKLGELWRFPPFRNATRLVAVPEDADPFISDLTRTFMGVLLANSEDIRTTVVFINAANMVSAARILLPFLARDGIRNVLLYIWQAAAAVYAAWARPTPPPPQINPPNPS